MEGSYCRSCFCDTTGDTTCRRCAHTRRLRTKSGFFGVISLPIVLVGTLTLDVRLCLIGAAIGMIALAVSIAASRPDA